MLKCIIFLLFLFVGAIAQSTATEVAVGTLSEAIQSTAAITPTVTKVETSLVVATSSAASDDKGSESESHTHRSKQENKSNKTAASTAEEEQSTAEPSIAATEVPDLLNDGTVVSIKDPGFVSLSVAFGLMTLAMAFL